MTRGVEHVLANGILNDGHLAAAAAKERKKRMNE